VNNHPTDPKWHAYPAGALFDGACLNLIEVARHMGVDDPQNVILYPSGLGSWYGEWLHVTGSTHGGAVYGLHAQPVHGAWDMRLHGASDGYTLRVHVANELYRELVGQIEHRDLGPSEPDIRRIAQLVHWQSCLG
jgi:hypothetical protein